MNEGDVARLAYLLLLIAAIGGYVVVQYRGRMKQAMQQAALWVLIFIGIIAAFGLWEDVRGDLGRQAVFSEEGQVEVPRGPDGHYHLALSINGQKVDFLVDTGATDMVLSRDDAARLGFDPDDLAYFGRAQTANGTVKTAPVTLDQVQLGPHMDRNVPARVNGGDMADSLLGMRYLDRFERIEIAGDKLTLSR